MGQSQNICFLSTPDVGQIVKQVVFGCILSCLKDPGLLVLRSPKLRPLRQGNPQVFPTPSKDSLMRTNKHSPNPLIRRFGTRAWETPVISFGPSHEVNQRRPTLPVELPQGPVCFPQLRKPFLARLFNPREPGNKGCVRFDQTFPICLAIWGTWTTEFPQAPTQARNTAAWNCNYKLVPMKIRHFCALPTPPREMLADPEVSQKWNGYGHGLRPGRCGGQNLLRTT